jgi:hypothetical protein
VDLLGQGFSAGLSQGVSLAQRQLSVESVSDGWALALNASARCGNPLRLDEIECLKEISPPPEPQVETDLLPETFHPVPLARSGKPGKPSALEQASGQALPYGSNGGLEAAPVALWSQPQHQVAARAPVSLQPQRLMESIEVGRAEPMPPYLPLATGAPLGPRPGKPSAQLKESLDADLNPEYQTNIPVVGGHPPICFRGKGAAYTLPTPNLPKTKKASPWRLKIIRYPTQSRQAILKKPLLFPPKDCGKQQTARTSPSR